MADTGLLYRVVDKALSVKTDLEKRRAYNREWRREKKQRERELQAEKDARAMAEIGNFP